MGQKHDLKKRGHKVAGGWYAVSVRHTGRYICSPVVVGGGGRLLVNLVPMLEQKKKKKNDEKMYFLQAGQCAALSSFRVRKMAF